jgi:hypothetical protein
MRWIFVLLGIFLSVTAFYALRLSTTIFQEIEALVLALISWLIIMGAAIMGEIRRGTKKITKSIDDLRNTVEIQNRAMRSDESINQRFDNIR